MSLNELKEKIIADGKVDVEEVAQLREVMLADGVIDREEAKVIFAINDACSGNDNCPEWEEFFVKSLTDHILGDANSPGDIDEEEAKFITEYVIKDGKVDELEKKLLSNLVGLSSNIHSLLQSKLDFLGIKKD